MIETSIQGIQVLRALALAVRSEQDFAFLGDAKVAVGVLKQGDPVPDDAVEAKERGGYAGVLEVSGYIPLNIRQALNKIAHADPQAADYYIGLRDTAHDLLLYGVHRGRSWFAVISLLRLIEAIRALPDATTLRQ